MQAATSRPSRPTSQASGPHHALHPRLVAGGVDHGDGSSGDERRRERRADYESMTVEELPAYFRAGQETLFGVLTTPAARHRTDTVVLLAAGGWPGTATARNRPLVTLARRLASDGLCAFDFDYRGVGESTGTAAFRLDRPLVADVQGALGWVRSQGFRRVLLCGICYGSRVVLAAAETVDGLAGVALVSLPPGDHGKRRAATVAQAADVGLGELIRRAWTRAAVQGLADPDLRGAYVRVARTKLRATMGRREPARPAPLGPVRTNVLATDDRQRLRRARAAPLLPLGLIAFLCTLGLIFVVTGLRLSRSFAVPEEYGASFVNREYFADFSGDPARGSIIAIRDSGFWPDARRRARSASPVVFPPRRPGARRSRTSSSKTRCPSRAKARRWARRSTRRGCGTEKQASRGT